MQHAQIYYLRRRIFYFGVVSLFLILNSGKVHAAAWPQSPGILFVEAKFQSFSSDSDAFGFESKDYIIYAEYGLAKGRTIGGKFMATDATTSAGSSNVSTSGVVYRGEGFVQSRLFSRGRLIVSGQLTGIYSQSFANNERSLSLDDGAGVDGRLQVGYSPKFGVLRPFISIEIGYRHRWRDRSNVRIDGQVGAYPHRRIMALAGFSTAVAPGEGAFPRAQLTKLQPTVAIELNRHFSLTIGGSFEFAPKKYYPGRTAMIGIWTKL